MTPEMREKKEELNDKMKPITEDEADLKDDVSEYIFRKLDSIQRMSEGINSVRMSQIGVGVGINQPMSSWSSVQSNMSNQT